MTDKSQYSEPRARFRDFNWKKFPVIGRFWKDDYQIPHPMYRTVKNAGAKIGAYGIGVYGLLFETLPNSGQQLSHWLLGTAAPEMTPLKLALYVMGVGAPIYTPKMIRLAKELYHGNYVEGGIFSDLLHYSREGGRKVGKHFGLRTPEEIALPHIIFPSLNQENIHPRIQLTSQYDPALLSPEGMHPAFWGKSGEKQRSMEELLSLGYDGPTNGNVLLRTDDGKTMMFTNQVAGKAKRQSASKKKKSSQQPVAPVPTSTVAEQKVIPTKSYAVRDEKKAHQSQLSVPSTDPSKDMQKSAIFRERSVFRKILDKIDDRLH